jgi:hypothetical protein
MRRWLVICLLLAACGMKQPEAEREKKTVASWDASLALTARYWTRGEVPKHFARHAAEAATEELSKNAKSQAAARTIALAHDLEDAIERDDRAAGSRIAVELDAQSKALQ